MKQKNKKNFGFGSLCSHENHNDKQHQPSQLPIYPTSSFRFDNIEEKIAAFSGQNDTLTYSRYGNPTVDAVAQKIASLEGYGLLDEPQAYLTSSGMSAITTTIMALVKAGDKILTQSNLYGGTTVLLRDVLQNFGVEIVYADFKNLKTIKTILKEDEAIKVLYTETPANPTMACIDLAAIASIAQFYNCYTITDNTFCTPYLQQPLTLGIDFVVHSTTKFLNGHGTGIAGAIIGRDPDLMRSKVWTRLKQMGTNCNPFDAWMINNGLKTLEIRMQRHCANAMVVAQFLEKHPKVLKVNYNGLPSHPDHELAKQQMRDFGGLMSFELIGGLETGKQFMNALNFCLLAPTLGDVSTLVLHPASTSHLNIPKAIRIENGITDGLIRISVGIENIDDIIDDLTQALEMIG